MAEPEAAVAEPEAAVAAETVAEAVAEAVAETVADPAQVAALRLRRVELDEQIEAACGEEDFERADDLETELRAVEAELADLGCPWTAARAQVDTDAR